MLRRADSVASSNATTKHWNTSTAPNRGRRPRDLGRRIRTPTSLGLTSNGRPPELNEGTSLDHVCWPNAERFLWIHPDVAAAKKTNDAAAVKATFQTRSGRHQFGPSAGIVYCQERKLSNMDLPVRLCRRLRHSQQALVRNQSGAKGRAASLSASKERIYMKSGIKKWSDRLQNVYASFAEFLHYNQIYNLAARLGYETGQEAWLANPLVEGSVIPEDYRARSHPSAKTAVIFRRWRRSGRRHRHLPRRPGNHGSQHRQYSYEHVGQHAACSPKLLLDVTVPARPRECRRLAEELQRIGYRLRPVFRQTAQHFVMRAALIAA